jgi:hypothetical protein
MLKTILKFNYFFKKDGKDFALCNISQLTAYHFHLKN